MARCALDEGTVGRLIPRDRAVKPHLVSKSLITKMLRFVTDFIISM
jgi:hypothetical protein